jgi:hypothetical protein
MKSKAERDNDNTNYYFLLKCLGGFAAAALLTAGVVGAVMYNASAATAAGFAVGGAVASAPIAPFILGPMLLIALGAVCLLPFIFCTGGSSGYNSTYLRTSPYPSSGLYNSPAYSSPWFFPSPAVVTSGNYHGHTSHGPVHTHDSTTVHSHPMGIGSNIHNHH